MGHSFYGEGWKQTSTSGCLAQAEMSSGDEGVIKLLWIHYRGESNYLAGIQQRLLGGVHNVFLHHWGECEYHSNVSAVKQPVLALTEHHYSC